MDPKEELKKRTDAELLYNKYKHHHSIKSLPAYKCHKEVKALKIAEISARIPPTSDGANGVMLTFENKDYTPMFVTKEFVAINPKLAAGGYVVVYADNYISYSPAEAFENGYTLIEE